MTRIAFVTGSAGFIGFHTCARLLNDGWTVVGLDAMTDYYDIALKERRHQFLGQHAGFTAVEARLEQPGRLVDLFATHRPDVLIHLAAQAGVRYSIDAPRTYVEANLMGTFELLEAARSYPPDHMLLASTSSAYGANTEMPYQECQRADWQMSFYAATKKATESMAHSYAHLYDLPTTMFRFFTVYGPWGRPDMALFEFTRAMLNGEKINVYNHGNMRRDFTYIDDLIEGVVRLIDVIPSEEGRVEGDSLSPVAPWRVVNIGNGSSVPLGDFIKAIEAALGLTAKKNLMDIQPGDVPATWADAGLIEALTGDRLPCTGLRDGVQAFVDWYRDYYRL